jgi:hypothetical protein
VVDCPELFVVYVGREHVRPLHSRTLQGAPVAKKVGLGHRSEQVERAPFTDRFCPIFRLLGPRLADLRRNGVSKQAHDEVGL